MASFTYDIYFLPLMYHLLLISLKIFMIISFLSLYLVADVSGTVWRLQCTMQNFAYLLNKPQPTLYPVFPRSNTIHFNYPKGGSQPSARWGKRQLCGRVLLCSSVIWSICGSISEAPDLMGSVVLLLGRTSDVQGSVNLQFSTIPSSPTPPCGPGSYSTLLVTSNLSVFLPPCKNHFRGLEEETEMTT